MGRHRTPRNLAAAALVVVTATLPAIAVVPQAEAAPPGGWAPIIRCESGGNPRAQNRSSSASGLFQFLDSTWRSLGYKGRAKDAPPATQYQAADKLYRRAGLRPWKASKRCWSGKVGLKSHIQPLPPPGVKPPKAEKVMRSVGKAPELADELVSKSTSGFGGVKPKVARAGHLLRDKFNVKRVLGLGSRRTAGSDHPRGKALDFMVDRTTGDRLAEYVLRNRKALGVKYVIWRQRINYGSGWQNMGNRGSRTANHFDHVHLSFA